MLVLSERLSAFVPDEKDARKTKIGANVSHARQIEVQRHKLNARVNVRVEVASSMRTATRYVGTGPTCFSQWSAAIGLCVIAYSLY